MDFGDVDKGVVILDEMVVAGKKVPGSIRIERCITNRGTRRGVDWFEADNGAMIDAMRGVIPPHELNQGFMLIDGVKGAIKYRTMPEAINSFENCPRAARIGNAPHHPGMFQVDLLLEGRHFELDVCETMTAACVIATKWCRMEGGQ